MAHGAAACAAVTVALSAAVLVGWAADISVLRSFAVGANVMQPWTAFGLALGGLGLLLCPSDRTKAPQAIVLLLVALLACAVLWEYWCKADLGIDRLLFSGAMAEEAAQFPGRMARMSAIELLVLAACLWSVRVPRLTRLSTGLATFGLLAAAVGLIGYAFGRYHPWMQGIQASLAIPAGLGFTILFAGFVLCNPQRGWIRILVAPHLGGATVRRLLPAALGLPLTVWLAIHMWSAGGQASLGYKTAMAALLITTLMSVVVLHVAQRLEAIDDDKRRAEADLRRSEARFQAAQEASLIGTVLLEPIRDANQRIVDFFCSYANPMARQLMGVGDNASAGALPQGRCPVLRDSLLRNYIEVAEGGSPLDFEFVYDFDGRRRWFRTFATRVEETLSVSLLEITDRKEAEQSFAQAEARYRTIYEQASVGIERVSTDDGRFIEVNQKGCDILGYRAEELMRLSPPEISHPQDWVVENSILEDMIAGRRDDYVIEKRALKKDNTVVWVRLTSSIPKGPAGRLPFRVSVIEDITEAKLLEQQLREAKLAAENASQEKSRFIAAASHDLRQPVQALTLLTATLAQQLKGHPATIVTHIEKSLASLTQLIEGLLDISRLDAGRILPNRRPYPLGEVLRRLFSEYSCRAERKRLSLGVVDTAAWGDTDPLLLERILRNLVENALRYTDKGTILIGCRRRGDQVAIQVIDTGIGIDALHLTEIFKEFYQVADTGKGGGLGLGLSIVQRLAKLLGHRVSVASKLGAGTAFTIEVPMVAAADASSSSERDAVHV